MNLSLIIPVYNVEKYISDCIESILNQQSHNISYEIIIIDDGSPDKSIEIVKEIAKTTPQIKIIRQENKGLGEARNTGIKNASGDFIWCIDSDDWIAPNSFKTLETKLSSNIDVIAISAINITNGNPIKRMNRTDINGTTVTGIQLLQHKSWTPCVPFNIYRREFLITHNLWQQGRIFHEDFEFTPRAYYYAKKILIIDRDLYFVRINPESITRKYNPQKNFDMLTVAKSLNSFKKETVTTKEQYIYTNLISMALNSALFGNSLMDKQHKSLFHKEIKNCHRLFFQMRYSTKTKYKIEGILFLLFPNNIINIYNLLSLIIKQ